jgi:hypothetical protein
VPLGAEAYTLPFRLAPYDAKPVAMLADGDGEEQPQNQRGPAARIAKKSTVLMRAAMRFVARCVGRYNSMLLSLSIILIFGTWLFHCSIA